jgi:hypothetical protein
MNEIFFGLCYIFFFNYNKHCALQFTLSLFLICFHTPNPAMKLGAHDGWWVGGVVRNSNGHEHWPAKLFWHLSMLLAASCKMNTFFLIIVLQILWVISLAANASTFVIGTYPIVIFQCNAPFPPVWEATFLFCMPEQQYCSNVSWLVLWFI